MNPRPSKKQQLSRGCHHKRRRIACVLAGLPNLEVGLHRPSIFGPLEDRTFWAIFVSADNNRGTLTLTSATSVLSSPTIPRKKPYSAGESVC